MDSEIIAGIDIGTNTILMTIVETRNGSISKILRDEHSIARLGEKLNERGYIGSSAIERASAILQFYRKLCDEYKVGRILAVATSAMREATNKESVKSIFSNILGTDIEIIEGEKEACLSYLGTIESDENSLVIDIGGGSTELIIGNGFNILQKHSLKIGAVLLTEMFIPNHPPDFSALEKINSYIDNHLKEIENIDFQGTAYAVAGTPTTLATIAQNLADFERTKVHGYLLELGVLDDILNNKLLKFSIEEIINVLRVNPRRADVITAGALILKRLMNFLQIEKIKVSVYGLRLGVIKYYLTSRL